VTTDHQNGALLAQLQRLVESDKPIEEGIFRRLVLVAMVQFNDRLAGLERRSQLDWRTLAIAAVIAVFTVAGAWAAP